VLELVERAGGDIIEIENEMQSYKPNTFFNMNDMRHYQEIMHIYEET